jgi:hypothetical protein
VRAVAFVTDFILLTTAYREEPKRSEVLKYLESLGFELYDVGKPSVVVFYLEAPTIKDIEDIIKAAESHEGVAKAYITYGFVADEATKRLINEGLEKGEIELDETTIEYIKKILAKLTGEKESKP